MGFVGLNFNDVFWGDTPQALSWMFRQGKINWNLLLIASVKQILLRYGITEGQLVLDETEQSV
jgi:hypothetical protein